MLALALLAQSALAGAPLEVKIADPAVVAVLLDCGSGAQYKANVVDGVAAFAQVPQAECVVNLLRKGGTIDKPGKWSCTLDACTIEDVHHLDVLNADGRINVILPGMHAGAAIEITCPDGWRGRVEIVENTATFDGVPDDRCTLNVKGGVPARFSPITWGTWFCELTGTTAVCSKRV